MAFQFADGDLFQCKRHGKIWEIYRCRVSIGQNRYDLSLLGNPGVQDSRSEDTLSDPSRYELIGGPSYNIPSRTPPQPKFSQGDVIDSYHGVAVYEILSIAPNPHGGFHYTFKVLNSKHAHRIGRLDRRGTDVIDNNYKLATKSSIAMAHGAKNMPMSAPPHPSAYMGTIQITQEPVANDALEEMRAQFKSCLPKCDCGARKCGYSDDELHAHARWCELVQKTFIVPIINKEN